MKKLILIIGKSAAGKDYISKRVSSELNIPIAVSFTTRGMRDGETNLVEYEFISNEEFKIKESNNEIIEHTSYNVASNMTWYYGLSKNQLEKSDYVIAIVNPDGKRQIEEKYGDSVVSILIESDDKIRLKRSLDREENPNVKEICRRFEQDSKDFENVSCDYIVYNNRITNRIIEEVKSIIKEEMEI